jgi:hypothetical protein
MSAKGSTADIRELAGKVSEVPILLQKWVEASPEE